MSRRALELGAGVTLHRSRGGQVVMATLTMRHHEGQALGMLWDVLGQAWDAVAKSRVWRKWRDRLGCIGYVRAVEVTHGANGWHVHIHLLLFVACRELGKIDSAEVAEFEGWLVPKWCRAVQALGLSAPRAIGQDVRLTDGSDWVGEYLVKGTDNLGLELTHSQGKAARSAHSTVTPWEFLTQIQQTGEVEALELWHEWEAASKGRRQLTWSRGLRDALSLDVEKSDEDVAAEVVGDDELLRIPAEVWDLDVVKRPEVIPRILDAAEKGSAELRRFLMAEGIGFEVDELGPCAAVRSGEGETGNEREGSAPVRSRRPAAVRGVPRASG